MASTVVLYRKWRPQTLGQVIGQEHVTRTLLNALAMGRVSHAYLFCGPRGTGKTSTARILAKAVNCLTNGKGEPCGTCTMCEAITQGRALDLVEIDAASNRGIDDIRELREKITFAPNEASYKVYVVDEVHMLTDPAFNALLKTLEEPPPHAIFVLATTEVQQVPVTIQSRCQRFDFRRISQQVLVEHLAHICAEEGIEAERAALELIVRSASGSARDAVNLLEQAEVSYGGRVQLQDVQSLLGITGDTRSMEVVKAVVHHELQQGMAAIQQVREEGVNLAQFGREVASLWRALLLLKAGTLEAVDVAPELLSELRDLAGNVSIETMAHAARSFSQLDFRAEAGSSLPLELALLDTVMPETTQAAVSPA
ncbi:MAG TPA: DNA polymerase III subunit gamma/tau, partial [Dehalococcoidia bacterium]|nr:DNA polymerase III subunit gamma/tau [Dehalococcoidia bacterium]